MATWEPLTTAPKDRLVLLWDDDVGHPEVARWNEGVHSWLIGYPDGDADNSKEVVPFTVFAPTHWMELPAKPGN